MEVVVVISNPKLARFRISAKRLQRNDQPNHSPVRRENEGIHWRSFHLNAISYRRSQWPYKSAIHSDRCVYPWTATNALIKSLLIGVDRNRLSVPFSRFQIQNASETSATQRNLLNNQLHNISQMAGSYSSLYCVSGHRWHTLTRKSYKKDLK